MCLGQIGLPGRVYYMPPVGIEPTIVRDTGATTQRTPPLVRRRRGRDPASTGSLSELLAGMVSMAENFEAL